MSRLRRVRAASRQQDSQGIVRAIANNLPAPISRTLCILLFASGISALIYQLLWIKQLSLVVGVEVYAVTTAVSAFFAGLAAGGAVFGSVADHNSRPLRLYAQLEIGVAILGVAVTLLLPHLALPFAALENRLGVAAWLPLFLLVALPAFLMGGTLPVLIRAQSPDTNGVGHAGGALYATNTAGAVCGALLTPFYLLPHFGVRGSSLLAALCNVAAAIFAFRCDREVHSRHTANEISNEVAQPGPLAHSTRIALALYALSGGIALGYEVLWSQIIIQFMSTRSFAFAIVLATFLSGIVLGSFIHARFADRVRDPWAVFGLLIASSGLLALACVSGIGRFFLLTQWQAGQTVLAITSSEFASMCARFFVAAMAVIFVPAVLLGAAFPAALRLIVSAARIGRDVGAVFALNTMGGIVGTLLTGFVLIPRFGLLRSLGCLAVAANLLGLVAVFRGNGPWRRIRWIAAALAIATVLLSFITPPEKLAFLTPRMHGSRGDVIFYEEDPGGTVTVIEEPAHQKRFRRLFIQGVSNSGDSLSSLRYMRLQALLPLLIHKGDPRETLVIGLGTGITAGATLAYPGLETRVADELMPGVVHSAKLFRGNFDASSNPALEIRLRDGRRDLLQRLQQYDLVTLEPPPPAAAGVVNLYSSDFYKLVRSRLKPNGLLAQWLPLPTQNDEDTRSLVRSFLDVFPYATLWTTELHEMMLVGSAAPIELDFDRISQRMQNPKVAAALSEVGIASPFALLATWITDRNGLELYAANALPVTDDRPRIEFASWVRRDEITRVLPKLLALQSEPPLRNRDEGAAAAITSERNNLHNFYGAGLAAYQGDRAQWERLIGPVIKADRLNPYYRWIVGGEPDDSPAVGR